MLSSKENQGRGVMENVFWVIVVPIAVSVISKIIEAPHTEPQSQAQSEPRRQPAFYQMGITVEVSFATWD